MRNIFLLLIGAALLGLAAEAPVRPSPPLSIQRVNAQQLPISQFRGKVVVVAFISTACSHCQELTQILSRLTSEYTARGVQFLGCAINGDASAALLEFLERFKPQFPVGWIGESVARSYLQRPISDGRPLYVPDMVFLDRRGMIRSDYSGESSFFTNSEANIRVELDKLLRQPGTSLAARQ